MKKLVFVLLSCCLVNIIFAQTPNLLQYQAVIRNSSGAVVANQPVGMRLSILKGKASGTTVYSETHRDTTSANGLVSVEIGAGSVVTGSFVSINWGQGPYFIKTETDITGGTNYLLNVTQQLLSVPYANYTNSVPVSKQGDTIIIGKNRMVIPGAMLLTSGNAPGSALGSLSSGLMAYYPFNGNAQDESDRKNHGKTLGATLTTDRFGAVNSAYQTSPDNQYIRTDSVLNGPINTFSISFWAYPQSQDKLVDQGIAGTEGYGLQSVIHPSHGQNWGDISLNAGAGISVGTNQVAVSEHTHLYISAPLVFRPSVNFSSWTHFTLIYDNHKPRLYVNGALVKEGQVSAIRNVRPSNGYDGVYNTSGFGNNFRPTGSPQGQFSGKFDEIRIYNRVLTQEEIAFLANN
jgi:hypothetical protein